MHGTSTIHKTTTTTRPIPFYTMISEDHCVVFDSLNERRRSRRRRTRTRQTPSSRQLFSWLLLSSSSSSSSSSLSLPMLWLLWLWSVAIWLLSCTCCVGAFTTQFSFQTPQQRHVQSAILTTKLRIEPTISRTRITTTTTILQSSTVAETTTTTIPSDRSPIGLNGDDGIMPSETLQRQRYGNEAVRVGVLLLNLGGPERTEDVEGGLLKHTTRL